jgi:hypothetical protein
MADFKRRFRAPPLRKRPANVLQFEQRTRRNHRVQAKARGTRWAWAILIASPFVGVGAVWLWHNTLTPTAMGVSGFLNGAEVVEQFSANFGECSGPIRHTCVVDGDTFWLNGDKIRIADINTPEVSDPQCSAEAELGARATQRLVELLNAGSFSLETVDRDEDQYGRKLRIVTRRGDSLGEALVKEGLAERWRGYRGSWC